MSQYQKLKQACYEANMQLPALGLVLFTFGNASVADRARQVFAIKPSGVPYATLRPEDIVVLDFQNNVVEGEKRPSSDTKTHAVLYGHWEHIGGIVHTHSTYATAWAQAQLDIPILGTTHADHLTADVPCAPPMEDRMIAGDYEHQTGWQIINEFQRRGLSPRDVSPILDEWFKELSAISQDLKDQKTKDVEFQESLEALYRRVDLPSLLKTLDFDAMAKDVQYPAHGARSLPVDFKNVSGLPTNLVFGRQIFAMKNGRSVIPHGHDNMATGFLVLKGDFRGRHWDRVEDHADHYIIRPTIDRKFALGETSTISDHKDNVHWFQCESEVGFLFNVHVIGYNPDNPKTGGRVYVDPLGEKLSGGLFKAPKISYGKANQMYG